jgi:hypothetical protein
MRNAFEYNFIELSILKAKFSSEVTLDRVDFKLVIHLQAWVSGGEY